MVRRETMCLRTRMNWLITFLAFSGGVITAITGIQSLFHPTGGFQGGRNPAFGSRVSLGQRGWDELHAWGAVLMIVAVGVHLVYHWSWVVMMAKRIAKSLRGVDARMSRGAKVNVFIDVILASSFVVTAISGLYFHVVGGGGYQAGANPVRDFTLLSGRATWDLVHIWSAVVLIVAAVVHIALHWRWILKVTRRVFRSILPQFGRQAGVEANTV